MIKFYILVPSINEVRNDKVLRLSDRLFKISLTYFIRHEKMKQPVTFFFLIQCNNITCGAWRAAAHCLRIIALVK